LITIKQNKKKKNQKKINKEKKINN